MIILLAWVLLSVAVGFAANTRGRDGMMWFFIALLISPLIAGAMVLALGWVPQEATSLPPEEQRLRNSVNARTVLIALSLAVAFCASLLMIAR